MRWDVLKNRAWFSWRPKLTQPMLTSDCRQLFIKSVKKCTVREWRIYPSLKNLTSLATGKTQGSPWSWTEVAGCASLRCAWRDVVVDRLVGGLLTLSSEYGFVLEDEEGICGYALGTVDVKPFIKKCQITWIPFMQEKYNKPDGQKDLTEAEVASPYT